MNNNKTNIKLLWLIPALLTLLLTSACANNKAANSENAIQPDSTVDNGASMPSDSDVDDQETAHNEILIIIDQTPKPGTGNSFDFFVEKRPEGYALSEMRWISDKNEIINSVQEAVEHGGNGEDGFYISGDAQFSGFFYPDEMKGEQGQVIFLFKNDASDELTWKKDLTLK